MAVTEGIIISEQIEGKVIKIIRGHMEVTEAKTTRDIDFTRDPNADSLDTVELRFFERDIYTG